MLLLCRVGLLKVCGCCFCWYWFVCFLIYLCILLFNFMFELCLLLVVWLLVRFLLLDVFIAVWCSLIACGCLSVYLCSSLCLVWFWWYVVWLMLIVLYTLVDCFRCWFCFVVCLDVCRFGYLVVWLCFVLSVCVFCGWSTGNFRYLAWML